MADESFIPAGQEELVGAMLGNGVALPGDCKLLSGDLQKTTIKGTYACRGGEVVVELSHPTNEPTNATRTEKFALRVERGTAPPDLESVLLSRIRERESQFRWTVPQDGQPRAEPAAVPTPSGAVVLGLLVFTALFLWRRRIRASRG